MKPATLKNKTQLSITSQTTLTAFFKLCASGKIVLLGVFLILLAIAPFLEGCATDAQSQNIVPTSFKLVTLHPKTVSLVIEGGRATNPMMGADIPNSVFQSALTEAITKSKVFTQVSDYSSSDYILKVSINASARQPQGFDLKDTMTATWELRSTHSNIVVWKDLIATDFTATMHDSFINAGKRFRMAREGAARENIQTAIEEISALKPEVIAQQQMQREKEQGAIQFRVLSASIPNGQQWECLQIASIQDNPQGLSLGPPSERQYKGFEPKTGSSFVVIEFCISNVLKPFLSKGSDVAIVDGKGVVHDALATTSGKGKDYWDAFFFVTFLPDSESQSRNFRWLYCIPSVAIAGSCVRFQGQTYPITISN
jgi:hypothetical protein